MRLATRYRYANLADKSEPELTLEQIIASMKKSNEDVNDSIRYGVLRQRHDKTIKRFKSASKHMRADTSIINEWSPNAIRKWATSFTEYREKRTLPPSQQSLDASFKGKLLPESERKRVRSDYCSIDEVKCF